MATYAATESIQHLSKVIDDAFPCIKYKICYGSQAFPQTSPSPQHSNTTSSSTTTKPDERQRNASFFASLSLANIVSPRYIHKLNEPMLDFIFIVDNSQHWHEQNLSTNHFYHYSSMLRYFGSSLVSYVQSLGPGVLYNPFVFLAHSNIMMKYGVISTSQLMADLCYWQSLYIAGRLHKPVLCLEHHNNHSFSMHAHQQQPLDMHRLHAFYQSVNRQHVQTEYVAKTDELADAFVLNLDFAVRVALILMITESKHVFTLKELFRTIAALSYCGDNRQQFCGEDVHKFDKIVNGSYPEFVRLYRVLLEHYVEPMGDDERYTVKESVDVVSLAEQLPLNLVQEMLSYDVDVLDNLHDARRVNECVKYALCKIVSSSSWIQTVKGFLSAGFVNSMWYVLRKVNKYCLSVSDPHNK